MNTTHYKEPTEQNEKQKGVLLLDAISLRDYFAAKAMQGLMGREWSHLKVTDAELFAIWAQGSYFAADAMLAAREQK